MLPVADLRFIGDLNLEDLNQYGIEKKLRDLPVPVPIPATPIMG